MPTTQWLLDNDPDLLVSQIETNLAQMVVPESVLVAYDIQAQAEVEDHSLRTAAWKDVAAKAKRLRDSGRIRVQAANQQMILTMVEGDHGTYACIVERGNYFEGSSAVTSYKCECPWGYWAFKREHTYVGRLCSHAYGSLLELNSLSRRKKPTNPNYTPWTP